MKSEYYSEWTDQELITEYKSLNASIYIYECFGARDIIRIIGNELINRGYEIEINDNKTVQITKEN